MKTVTKMTYLLTFLFPVFLLATSCDEGDDCRCKDIYRENGIMNVDGRARTYLLNLPPDYYDNSREYSLVFGLHGAGGKASQFEQNYKFTEKANASGFIVVYPEGVQSDGRFGIRTWNAGSCCDYAMENDVDDVKFISTLIDSLIMDFRINPKKVYVTGMSNGGMMAYRLASEIPEKIAAIAPVSCTMVMQEPIHPSRSVPVLHIHSALDTKVPYQGGYGLMNYYFPPVDSVLEVWSGEEDCQVEAEVVIHNTDYKMTRWSDCDAGSLIECYLTEDGGHSWPGGLKTSDWADEPSHVINANDLIWDFFQQFELP